MKTNAAEILAGLVVAISGWNLLETISLGKQVAALQAEIHRLDASRGNPEKEIVYVANTDFDRTDSVRRLLDIQRAGHTATLR